MDNSTRRYTVIIYSENQIGLLAQVSNVFTRRSLSIWSLSAGASAIDGIHTITIVTDGTEKKVIEAVHQLEKRVDVVKVFYYVEDDIIYRELALYKVATDSIIEAGNIEEILAKWNAKIVEINRNFAVIVKTGTTKETQDLYDALRSYGIMQFQRSGRIAVSRERQEPVLDFLEQRERDKAGNNNIE